MLNGSLIISELLKKIEEYRGQTIKATSLFMRNKKTIYKTDFLSTKGNIATLQK